MRHLKLTQLASIIAVAGLSIGLTQATTTLSPITVVGSYDKFAHVDRTTSVVTLNQAQLQATGAHKLDQALHYQAGVQADYANANHYSLIRVRGFAPGFSVNGANITPSNSYYVYNPVLFGMQSVELPLGTSSVLTGAADGGSVVNLITKRPLTTTQGLVQLQAGTRDYYALGGDYSYVASPTLQYRVVGQYLHKTGQKDYSGTTQAYFAPSATIHLTSQDRVTYLANISNQNGRPSQFVIPSYGSFIADDKHGTFSPNLYFGEPEYSHLNNTQFNLGYEYTHDFNSDFKFISSYNYNHIHQYFLDVVAGIALKMGDQVLAQRNYAFANGNFASHYFDNRVEKRFTINPALTDILVAGVDLAHSYVHGQLNGNGTFSDPKDPRSMMNDFVSLFNPSYGNPTVRQILRFPHGHLDRETTNNAALYLFNSFNYNHALTLNVGLRYDRYNGKTTSNLGTSRYQGGHLSKSAGVSYEFDNGLAPFVNYADSFKIRARYLTANRRGIVDSTPFGLETTTQYSAGFKYDPEFLTGNFRVAYFNITEKDPYKRDDAAGIYTQLTGGKLTAKGVEFQANFHPSDYSHLKISYTYTKAETTARNPYNPKPIFDTYQTPFMPVHTAALWGDYTVASQNNLNVGIGIRYLGKTYAHQVGYLNFGMPPASGHGHGGIMAGNHPSTTPTAPTAGQPPASPTASQPAQPQPVAQPSSEETATTSTASTSAAMSGQGGGMTHTGTPTSHGSHSHGHAGPIPVFHNDDTKAIFLLDVAITYPIDNHWTFQLNGTNLLNKTYISGCNGICYYGEGRRVTGTINYKF